MLENIALVAGILGVIAFAAFCIIAGSKRWREVQANNERIMRISQEAISDRKKILAAVEDIRAILQDRKS